MRKATAALVAALTALAISSARADDAAMVTYKSLTPEMALQAAQAAMKTCRDNGYQISVAVVDRFGLPQVLLRDRFAGLP
ncbi:MAG TPA: heme-binding protein, partial [Xanthobacteraceae bacterium]|nr:heme-binding protein [Xanthobacteraceae bacterium]